MAVGKKKAMSATKATAQAKEAAFKTSVKKEASKNVRAKKPMDEKKPALAKKPASSKQPAPKTVAPEKSVATAAHAPVKRVKVPKPVIRESVLKNQPSVQARPPFQPVPTLAQTQAKKKVKKSRFSKKDLELFKVELISMRDRILGRSNTMQNAALQGTDDINPEEDGTDAFLRLQTLDQVKNQHELIAKINTALRAIDDGTYGICCNCGELIRKQRLAVLPFAKHCIKCQSELERPRYGRG